MMKYQEDIFFLLHIFIFISFLISSSGFAASTPRLHQDEVGALKEIGRKLGIEKRVWNFDLDPCSGEGNWSLPETRNFVETSLTCDCSFDSNTTCRVFRIALKSQNISAGIPPEFSKLRHLQKLDLSRNYLNGTLPQQWATMRLNELSIEGNLFSGSIPQEIGNLLNLQKLRLSDNNFTGKIPTFIGNLTHIEKLLIQGCSLEGPIPSSISLLTDLIDLRISDLKGRGSTFPPLKKLKKLKKLILRNCLIYGEIPGYIGEMATLKTLDLSFNDLTGEIPESFVQLAKADYMYLTRNNLTGPIPAWILSRNKIVDISYNQFTWQSSSPIECPRGSVNLVEGYSSSANKINNIHPCLKKDFPCSSSAKQHIYSLHINCGGKKVTANNTTYESDTEARGASMFYSGENWAFSSTGDFLDDDVDYDLYVQSNTSSLSNVSFTPDKELYMTARLSPLSLTYYGLCLMNGNYNVILHFAEIVFSNDHTFNNLGRRIFDVYIQETLVLKDFDIAKEAGGPGIPITKNFNVSITSHTLKIRLYWAGRGTTGIPDRGTYGPLISAISVNPNFDPPVDSTKIQVGLVLGPVAGGLFIVLLILAILWRNGCLGGKMAADKELRGLDLQTGVFTLRQIKAATKNFDAENKLGEGGFGAVYKGHLPDGTVIAVKQLSSKSKQGNREFVNEIGMISALQHPNLVKLYGCCVEGNQLSLIYEYMENNCLSRALFGQDRSSKTKLTWPVRWKICLGIARGLAYLHEESQLKIVHRDIKTSNVLLDKDLNPKISDFGLAKLNEDGNTHISTRVAGTIGYMAPEYAMRGYLTDKADVYSFGVVAMEIVSGKSNTNYRPTEEFVYLLDWAYVLQERGSLLELVDPDLGSEYSSEEAMTMLNVALLCTNASPTLRPTMSQVVSMLEGRTDVQDLLSDPGFSTIYPKFKAIRNHFWQNPSQTLSISSNSPYSNYSHSDREENQIHTSVDSVVSIL